MTTGKRQIFGLPGLFDFLMGRFNKIKNLFTPKKSFFIYFLYHTNLKKFKQTRCSLGRSTNLYVTDLKQAIHFGTLFFGIKTCLNKMWIICSFFSFHLNLSVEASHKMQNFAQNPGGPPLLGNVQNIMKD